MKSGRKKKETNGSSQEILDSYFYKNSEKTKNGQHPTGMKPENTNQNMINGKRPRKLLFGMNYKESEVDDDLDFGKEEEKKKKGKRKREEDFVVESEENEGEDEEKPEKTKQKPKKKEKLQKPQKESKGKKYIKKVKPDKKRPEEGKVGRRGFKLCRGENCNMLIYIHQKTCPHCKFSFTFSNPKAILNKSDSLLTKAEKLLNAKKARKDMMINSNSVKGSILFKDSFNSDPDFFKVARGDVTRRIFSEFLTNQVNYKITEDLTFTNELSNGETEKSMKLKVVQDKGDPREVSLSLGQMHTIRADENDGMAQYFINLRFPITSVAWAPRTGGDQYLAVGISSNNYEELYTDSLQSLTVKLKNMNYLHKLGKQYPPLDGTIVLYTMPCLKTLDAFGEPTKLYQLKYSEEGTPLVLKWNQKVSSSPHEIGLLCVLSARGSLNIISVPLLTGINQPSEGEAVNVPILVNIFLGPERQLSCFDWKMNLASDEILAGDIMGNIYWIKISFGEEELVSYNILSVISEAHKGMVTQIDIFPRNNENACLFASASHDGVLKVFDFYEGSSPILELGIFTKPLTEIKWDFGGKFIIICKEGPSAPGELIGFFQRKKIELSHDNLTDKLELRKLEFDFRQRLNFTNTYMACSNSNFGQYTFLSDINGNVFGFRTESFRKTGSNKGTDSTIINFSKCEYVGEGPSFVLYPASVLQKREKASTKNNMSFESSINALHLNPNNIKEIVADESSIQGLLAFGNLSGLLSVSLVKDGLITEK